MVKTPAVPEGERRSAAIPALLAALTVASSLYFFTGGGANQAAHFCVVRSLLEEGTVRIDSYYGITQDVSIVDGHRYSNKTPGLPIFATPFVATARAVVRAFGMDTTSERALFWMARVAIFFGSTVPATAIVLLIYSLSRRFGASLGAAVFAALGFALGSPAWSYGTIFWAHCLTGSCLLAGYASAVLLEDSTSAERDLQCGMASGLFAGWAVLTEYHALGAAAIIAGFALWNARPGGRLRIRRVAAAVAAGGSVPALLLMGYQFAAFGSPFRLSYQTTITADVHQEGFLGLTFPKLNIMRELMVGEYRGILPSAPVLVVAIAGLFILGRSLPRRPAALAAGGIFIYYFLFNSSLYFWAAGWTFGPRYLFPGMTLLAVGLAPAWDAVGRAGRPLLACLGLGSVFLNLVAVSVQPFAPEGLQHPIQKLYLPAFLDGRVSDNNGPFYGGFAAKAFNFGEVLGLKGLASLLPLFAIWAILVASFAWGIRSGRRPAAAEVPA